MIRKFKEITTLIFTLILFGQSFGQKNLYLKIKNYDLTSVYKPDSIIDDSNEKIKLAEPLGFIGTNFQRLQIHFISIKKSRTNPYEYNVLGKKKSMKTFVVSKELLKLYQLYLKRMKK